MSRTSVVAGETLSFHVRTNPARPYRIYIYRLGWYGGAGARQMTCLPSCSTAFTGVSRSVPAPNSQTGLVNAGWPATTGTNSSLTIPANWVSGEYMAEFVFTNGDMSNGVARYYPFVVRSTAPTPSEYLVVVPNLTYNAYNNWGGTSAYQNNTNGSVFDLEHATKVSFSRPYHRREWRIWDYPLLRFLEREGYNVSYVSEADVDADPSLLTQHRAVIVSGHGEYWTQAMRDAYDASVAAGSNLAFMGANDAYWQVRLEDSGCSPGSAVCANVGNRRTMVIYKDYEDPAPDPADRTIQFRDLGRPECELQGGVMYGGYFTDDGYRDYTVTAAGAADPWLQGTGLTTGSVLTGLMGFEWDTFWPGCATPGSPTILFQYAGPELLDQEPSPATGITAAAVKYEPPASGARVFSSGSMQFAWGLDSYRWDPIVSGVPTDSRAQQLTRNMFADLRRPASPAGLALTPGGHELLIDTTPRSDPRITGYKVFRHAGTAAFAPGDPGVTLVCQNASGDCSDGPPGGTYRYASVAVDQWADSAPRLSAAIVFNPAPPAPSISATDPASPSSSSTTPKVTGSSSADTATVQLFTEANCAGAATEGSKAAFEGAGIEVTVSSNATTTLSATASDAADNASACSNNLAYTHDDIAPGAPTITSTDPASPSNSSTTPKLIGTASSDTATVRVYAEAGCAGSFTSGSKATFEGVGIGTTVGANTTTALFAKAVDAAGNVSGCSEDLAYTHDSIAPAAPSISATDPASPSNSSTTPRVIGSSAFDAGIVRIHTQASCGGGSTSDSSETFEGEGIQVTVGSNATTTLSAKAVDAAGNVSACSDDLAYTHDTIGPAAPVVTATSPASPSNSSTTPNVIGTSSADTATVRIYAEAGCAGSFESGSRASFQGVGIGTTVGSNTTTALSAEAVDASGNVSACSNNLAYTHDDVAPAAPSISATDPASPSNSSTTPRVIGTSSADTATVRVHTGASCAGAFADGPRPAFEGAGIQATVGSNTTTALSAEAVDAAGNVSGCSGELAYTHDSIAPDSLIISGPAARTRKRRASFGFGSSEAGSSFLCSLDGGAFKPCSPPVAYRRLGARRHSFRVQASDQAGNADPTPGRRFWKVKRREKR